MNLSELKAEELSLLIENSLFKILNERFISIKNRSNDCQFINIAQTYTELNEIGGIK